MESLISLEDEPAGPYRLHFLTGMAPTIPVWWGPYRFKLRGLVIACNRYGGGHTGMAPTIPVWPSHFIFQADYGNCGWSQYWALQELDEDAREGCRALQILFLLTTKKWPNSDSKYIGAKKQQCTIQICLSKSRGLQIPGFFFSVITT